MRKSSPSSPVLSRSLVMAIQPIILDEFGAILIPFQDHARATFTAKYLVGTHDGCTGSNNEVYAQYHSPTHNCLVCQGCSLRIIILKDTLPLVITDEVFEPLRRYLANQATVAFAQR